MDIVTYDDPEAVRSEIDGYYQQAQRQWQSVFGWNHMDMTPAQLERFRAFETAGGNRRVACGLLYGRLLRRTGRIG